MPYLNSEKQRLSAAERKKRYRARLHDDRYGVGAGDQRGKKAAGRALDGVEHNGFPGVRP